MPEEFQLIVSHHNQLMVGRQVHEANANVEDNDINLIYVFTLKSKRPRWEKKGEGK